MGWLCSECGTENRFREAHCRACLRRGSIAAYVIGVCVTLYERCCAHRLGRFAESVWDRANRIIGRIQRAGRIVMIICTAVSILLLLFMLGNAIRSGNLQANLERLGAQSLETVNRLGARIAERIKTVEPDGQAWNIKTASDRLEQLGRNAGGLLEELLSAAERLGGRLPRLGRGLVQELPRLDIHIVSWLINGSYELYSWLHGMDVEWLGGVERGVLTAGEYLAKLSVWLQSLRR